MLEHVAAGFRRKDEIDVVLKQLEKDFYKNWMKRRAAVIVRNDKLLNDRTELYAHQNFLNERWTELTGDPGQLLQPLNYRDRFTACF